MIFRLTRKNRNRFHHYYHFCILNILFVILFMHYIYFFMKISSFIATDFILMCKLIFVPLLFTTSVYHHLIVSYTPKFKKKIIRSIKSITAVYSISKSSISGACPFIWPQMYYYNAATIHKYMNVEMGMQPIMRPKRPDHKAGKSHKIFGNKLKQVFTTAKINQKWCTDFAYLLFGKLDEASSGTKAIMRIA